MDLENKSASLARYDTCKDGRGGIVAKQQSEFVFIEQSLRLLRPGGTLAIVLPKGAISNQSARMSDTRRALEKLGYVYAVVALPPETFSVTGTQTTTSVVFMRKYKGAEEADQSVKIAYADVTNVGYDATGRHRSGSQIPGVARDVRAAIASGKPVGIVRTLRKVRKGESLTALSRLISSNDTAAPKHTLRDAVERIVTGRTPPRAAYADAGLFVVKVGNLSGRGIDWTPRERNFISATEASKRERAGLLLRPGDIVLTSSAHSSAYIGKKVDVVTEMPAWLGGRASLVGEVMLIRPKLDVVDPFVLLAYLRSPNVYAQLQRLARGQTAHLHPDDVYQLPLDARVLKPDAELRALADCLRTQHGATDRLNAINEQARVLFAERVRAYGISRLIV